MLWPKGYEARIHLTDRQCRALSLTNGADSIQACDFDFLSLGNRWRLILRARIRPRSWFQALNPNGGRLCLWRIDDDRDRSESWLQYGDSSNSS